MHGGKMQITEIRVKIMNAESGHRLRAFCSITFEDCFVIRDLKIIDGIDGLFVAMPNRRISQSCRHCNNKNHLRSHFCNQCGQRLPDVPRENRSKLFVDVAHPITSEYRDQLRSEVLNEFHRELDRSRRPGYVSRYDEIDWRPGHPTSEVSARRYDHGGSRESKPNGTSPTKTHRSMRTKKNSNDRFGVGIF